MSSDKKCYLKDYRREIPLKIEQRNLKKEIKLISDEANYTLFYVKDPNDCILLKFYIQLWKLTQARYVSPKKKATEVTCESTTDREFIDFILSNETETHWLIFQNFEEKQRFEIVISEKEAYIKNNHDYLKILEFCQNYDKMRYFKKKKSSKASELENKSLDCSSNTPFALKGQFSIKSPTERNESDTLGILTSPSPRLKDTVTTSEDNIMIFDFESAEKIPQEKYSFYEPKNFKIPTKNLQSIEGISLGKKLSYRHSVKPSTICTVSSDHSEDEITPRFDLEKKLNKNQLIKIPTSHRDSDNFLELIDKKSINEFGFHHSSIDIYPKSSIELDNQDKRPSSLKYNIYGESNPNNQCNRGEDISEEEDVKDQIVGLELFHTTRSFEYLKNEMDDRVTPEKSTHSIENKIQSDKISVDIGFGVINESHEEFYSSYFSPIPICYNNSRLGNDIFDTQKSEQNTGDNVEEIDVISINSYLDNINESVSFVEPKDQVIQEIADQICTSSEAIKQKRQYKRPPKPKNTCITLKGTVSDNRGKSILQNRKSQIEEDYKTLDKIKTNFYRCESTNSNSNDDSPGAHSNSPFVDTRSYGIIDNGSPRITSDNSLAEKESNYKNPYNCASSIINDSLCTENFNELFGIPSRLDTFRSSVSEESSEKDLPKKAECKFFYCEKIGWSSKQSVISGDGLDYYHEKITISSQVMANSNEFNEFGFYRKKKKNSGSKFFLCCW